MHRSSCGAEKEAAAVAETTTVDLGFRASTVNAELLFPSLWGRVTDAPVGGNKGEEREKV